MCFPSDGKALFLVERGIPRVLGHAVVVSSFLPVLLVPSKGATGPGRPKALVDTFRPLSILLMSRTQTFCKVAECPKEMGVQS